MAYKIKKQKAKRINWNRKYPSYIITEDDKFNYRMGFYDGSTNEIQKDIKSLSKKTGI